jgi:hypothetical protein
MKNAAPVEQKCQCNGTGTSEAGGQGQIDANDSLTHMIAGNTRLSVELVAGLGLLQIGNDCQLTSNGDSSCPLQLK